MKVKQVHHWLTDKSRGKGRRTGLASEDKLALLPPKKKSISSDNHKSTTTEDDGSFPTPSADVVKMTNKNAFLTPTALNETEFDLEKNPSTDPTIATQDEESTTFGDSPQKATSWDHTPKSNASWDKIFPDPEPVYDSSPFSSFEGSTEAMENLGDFHAGEYYAREDRSLGGSPGDMKPSKMYNANIFGNKLMTARTLDFICNDGNLIQRAYSTPDYHITDDEATTSSLSRDSPSITPGTLESKMARYLLDPYPTNESIQEKGVTNRAHRSIPRCKKIDPKELAFLNPKEDPASGSLPFDADKYLSVSRGINKFGGPKKTLVERRKEQLEKIWSDSREKAHVKKTKWDICKKTGQYKKKIVIDIEQK